jgi:hypothetical protein
LGYRASATGVGGGAGDCGSVFRAGFPALRARCGGESHWGMRSPMVEMVEEWGGWSYWEGF